MLKRFIDISLSIIGIVLFLPLFPLIAIIIKFDSKGPVFFLCDRIGKDLKVFGMYKFRTMYTTPIPTGPSVCPEDDPRVTSVGRFLRRSKINEFPQLINVLQGAMTLVGPRPEAPELAALYPPHAQIIFNVKPGLVGPNQILGRNEEEWYPAGVDPQEFYINAILPKKLPVDLEYVRQSSNFVDLKYILLGLRETLFKAVNWNILLQNRSQIYLLFSDIALCLIAFSLALILGTPDLPHSKNPVSLLPILPLVAAIRILCFVYCGSYKTLIRHLSFHDITGVLKGAALGSVLIVSLTTLISFRNLAHEVFLLDLLFLVFLMSFMRLTLRFYWDWHIKGSAEPRRRVLIYGAGDAGALAYHSLMAEKEMVFEVVGFLDDDKAKRHKTLYGQKVLGNRHTLAAVVKLYQVDSIFLAMPSTPFYEIAQIIRACQNAGVAYSVFPTLKNALLAADPHKQVRTLTDLIDTQATRINTAEVQPLLANKRIVLIGACGELGVELCQKILSYSPAQLLIVDRYESPLTELVSRLKNAFPTSKIRPVLCGPMNHSKISDVFTEYQPHVVFHAATRKYVPSFDIPVEDILRINYLWTFDVAKQAAACYSQHFVMLSSVAAKERGGPIADSLRAAELSLKQFFISSTTRFLTVRLCDIVENRGGVVAQLKEQISHLEPITLPHPDEMCYVISKKSAVHLILNSLALSAASPIDESLFIDARGASVPLLEIAQKLAALNGLQLETDLPLKFLNHNVQQLSSAWAAVPTTTAKCDVRENDIHDHLMPGHQTTYSTEVLAAINYLLNMKEQDLESGLWAQHTQTLLGLSNTN